MSTSDYPLVHNDHGFEWGPLRVWRLMSHDLGGVLLRVETAHGSVELRATPKGSRLQLMEIHGAVDIGRSRDE